MKSVEFYLVESPPLDNFILHQNLNGAEAFKRSAVSAQLMFVLCTEGRIDMKLMDKHCLVHSPIVPFISTVLRGRTHSFTFRFLKHLNRFIGASSALRSQVSFVIRVTVSLGYN